MARRKKKVTKKKVVVEKPEVVETPAEETKPEEIKEKKESGKSYVTDDSVVAEVVQKATGVIPTVTGNTLLRTRKYEFKGVSSKDAQDAVGKADKDEKGRIVLS